jgi:hypothetical protein
MATQNFQFSETANAQGVVVVTKQANTGPLKAKIKKVQFQTNSNCQGRAHDLVATVSSGGQPDTFNLHYTDCQSAQMAVDKKYGGNVTFQLKTGGFSPGEVVTGSGQVEYSIVLFGVMGAGGEPNAESEVEPADLHLRIQ